MPRFVVRSPATRAGAFLGVNYSLYARRINGNYDRAFTPNGESIPTGSWASRAWLEKLSGRPSSVQGSEIARCESRARFVASSHAKYFRSAEGSNCGVERPPPEMIPEGSPRAILRGALTASHAEWFHRTMTPLHRRGMSRFRGWFIASRHRLTNLPDNVRVGVRCTGGLAALPLEQFRPGLEPTRATATSGLPRPEVALPAQTTYHHH